MRHRLVHSASSFMLYNVHHTKISSHHKHLLRTFKDRTPFVVIVPRSHRKCLLNSDKLTASSVPFALWRMSAIIHVYSICIWEFDTACHFSTGTIVRTALVAWWGTLAITVRGSLRSRVPWWQKHSLTHGFGRSRRNHIFDNMKLWQIMASQNVHSMMPRNYQNHPIPRSIFTTVRTRMTEHRTRPYSKLPETLRLTPFAFSFSVWGVPVRLGLWKL